VSGMEKQKAESPGVLRWDQVLELACSGNVKPPRRVEKTDAEWRGALTEEQYYVARHKGTERAFSSEMCSLFAPGRYHCICCDTPLFDSTSKFDSRTEAWRRRGDQNEETERKGIGTAIFLRLPAREREGSRIQD